MGDGGGEQLEGEGEAGGVGVDDIVGEELGEGDEGEGGDGGGGGGGANNLEKGVKEGGGIDGANVATIFQIGAETGEGGDEGIILHALALLPAETPAVGEGEVVGDDGAFISGTGRVGETGGDARGTENGRNGGMRPSIVLAHGGGDGDTF